MSEWFTCARPPSAEYTLTLADATVLSNLTICAECLGAFRIENWIAVSEATTVGP